MNLQLQGLDSELDLEPALAGALLLQVEALQVVLRGCKMDTVL